MNFDYVVFRHRPQNKTKPKQIVLAGFLTLKKAMAYAEDREYDFMADGFTCIDAPDGIYTLGDAVDPRDCNNVWYAPGKRVYYYSGIDDKVLELMDLAPRIASQFGSMERVHETITQKKQMREEETRYNLFERFLEQHPKIKSMFEQFVQPITRGKVKERSRDEPSR